MPAPFKNYNKKNWHLLKRKKKTYTNLTPLLPSIAPPGAAAIRSVSTYDQNGSDIFLPSLPADPQSLWTTLHLECGAQFSTAEAEFRWLFRGRPASVTAPGFVQTNDDRLLMSAPSVSELVGSVQCLVVTAAGTSFASARILISGTPFFFGGGGGGGGGEALPVFMNLVLGFVPLSHPSPS